MIKYKLIIIPFISLILSQIIKFTLESIKNKKLCYERLFTGSGGMPSTHSSFVSSLTTLIYLNNGLNSEYFAISLIFSLIVIYDSIGVRYEVGKHAKIINNITKEMPFNEALKEKIGHKLTEVINGIILGLIIALIFNC